MNLKRLGLLFIMTLLTGCAGFEVVGVSPSVQGSQIVVYRTDSYPHRFNAILDGEQTSSSIMRKNARVYIVKPGQHTFTVELPTIALSAKLEPVNKLTTIVGENERKFIHLKNLGSSVNVSLYSSLGGPTEVASGTYRFVAQEVPSERAIKEIEGLKFFNGEEDAEKLGFKVKSSSRY